MYVVSLSDSA